MSSCSKILGLLGLLASASACSVDTTRPANDGETLFDAGESSPDAGSPPGAGPGDGDGDGDPSHDDAGYAADSAIPDASSGPLRLVALGDTGEANEAQRLVAERMGEKCRNVGGCHGALLLGDNFYDNGVTSTTDPQWLTKFENIYDVLGLNGLRFYVALGNHDYGYTSSGSRDAQIDYTTLPVGEADGQRKSDKWFLPSPYYDRALGLVHLFVLDNQDFSAKQRDDMTARVAASKARWKIVFGHFPRYTSGDHQSDNELVGALGMFQTQTAVSCGADLYLSGHDHDMEWIERGQSKECPNVTFAISGAGSKTRESAGSRLEHQAFYDETHIGFLYLEIDATSMKVEFVASTGETLFADQLVKP